MAWLQCVPVRFAAGGWPGRRLSGRWCGGTGIDPIIRSRNRSLLRKARVALPRLDRACGRLQPRRPMLRDREQSGRSPHGRAQTLGREHGPAAIPASSVHQLGRGTGIPARWQGPGRGRLRWTRPVLGYLDRPGDWPAASSRGDGSDPGLQPGRHDDRGGSRQREGQVRHPAMGYQNASTPR